MGLKEFLRAKQEKDNCTHKRQRTLISNFAGLLFLFARNFLLGRQPSVAIRAAACSNRPRRQANVEAAFGDLHNHRLRRFALRTRGKVDARWKLFALLHNR